MLLGLSPGKTVVHNPKPHHNVLRYTEDSSAPAKIQNGKQDIPGRKWEHRRGSGSLVSFTLSAVETKAVLVDFHSPHLILPVMYTFAQIQQKTNTLPLTAAFHCVATLGEKVGELNISHHKNGTLQSLRK